LTHTIMFSREELPDLIAQLTSSEEADVLNKCCLSAAQLAQELIVTEEGGINDDVAELLDDTLLQGLVDTIRNCETKPKVAVRNALRALADISKMTQAKEKLLSLDIFGAIKTYLERTADNQRQTLTKEVFSFAACALVNNLITAESAATLISLGYTPLLLRLLKTSMTNRPAASAFAASLLTKIAETDDGKADMLRNEAQTTLTYVFEKSNAVEGASANKDDLLIVLKVSSRIVSLLCSNQVNIPIFAQGGFIPQLMTAARILSTTECSIPAPSTSAAPALGALLSMMVTEEGGDEVNTNVDIVTMLALLKHALTTNPDDPETSKALTKLSLGIGGSFTGEPDCLVTAAQFIVGLNEACRVFCEKDSEVIFILTSLIVHLSSFDGGLEALQTDDSIATAAQMVQYFLTQEKSEVTQSILRNECVMLSSAVSSPAVIPLFAQHGLFPHLKDICALHPELNSEITETALVLLQSISSTPEGLAEVGKVAFTAIFRDILEYFTSVNLTDERRDSIIAIVKQLTESVSA